ncbi:HAD family hydrolase [Paludifilum halophilum]|uniref:HAD family hydrolase n=1 Tax=Paludifilum halophilum TaxID=1642702 RepID=A0A235B5P2_9BACL|nr:HAD family hydrolase [Paludifilum halophilum]OYD07610.1 hypothetical protein CHM34_09005 [Paludifilum halophilum]
MLQAIVFDFDGLILDTETHEFQTFQDLFREHGAELPLEEWSRVVGSSDSDFDPYAYLERCVGKRLDREALKEKCRKRHLASIEGEKALPGVEDVLKQAQALGWKIGLASSSVRDWVEGHLESLGLRHYFECIRTREDVQRTKPDPSLYLQAAECLGVHPSEAVAVEDSPNGALAAKRAGMACIVVPNSVTAQFSFGSVDLRLSSLEELKLADWASGR